MCFIENDGVAPEEFVVETTRLDAVDGDSGANDGTGRCISEEIVEGTEPTKDAIVVESDELNAGEMGTDLLLVVDV